MQTESSLRNLSPAEIAAMRYKEQLIRQGKTENEIREAMLARRTAALYPGSYEPNTPDQQLLTSQLSAIRAGADESALTANNNNFELRLRRLRNK